MPKSKAMQAAYKAAKKLRIKIVEDDAPMRQAGMWRGGRTITINPKKANPYIVLHEIGHVLCGYACCREHCEYQAHGAAIALARVHGIRLRREWVERIDVYAGWSARRACGAYKRGKDGNQDS